MRLVAALLAVLAGQASAQITAARYAEPTDRYPHGALGTPITFAAMQVTLADGSRRVLRWSSGVVFEDTAPRLVDLDGDGAPEIITVESSETRGARLAVWGLDAAGALVALAATPHLGTRFRWLAVAGAADLDGDGLVEIAYVDRPHLAQVLRILRFRRTDAATVTLEEVAAVPGLTNHRFGDAAISGGLRDCAGRLSIVTASADWSRVMATGIDGGNATTVDLGPNDRPDALARALACKN